MHHIICDGGTMMIIEDELNKYYYDEELEELEIQYSDYAINMNEKKNSGKLNEQIEIYKEIFSNEYEILNIPTRNNTLNNDKINKEIDVNNSRYEQVIDKSISENVNEFIKKHNISKTALFLSIYGYVLSKYSGQDTIYTSMMSANRNNHYVENMAGMFMSTLPLLLKFHDEEKQFIEIIKNNMEMLVNIYKHQDISFAELIENLKLKKVNNSFVFQPNVSNKNNEEKNKTIFDTNNNINLNSLSEIENELKQNNNNSKFDISFNVVENEEDYLISIKYNVLLYDSKMIKNIVNSFVEIIKNIKSLESNNIKDIEYIPKEEKRKILKEFNSDVFKEGCDKLYHEEF
eukprot:jgi/Orpsp1_1/1184299/evm.model.c7180000088989.1